MKRERKKEREKERRDAAVNEWHHDGHHQHHSHHYRDDHHRDREAEIVVYKCYMCWLTTGAVDLTEEEGHAYANEPRPGPRWKRIGRKKRNEKKEKRRKNRLRLRLIRIRSKKKGLQELNGRPPLLVTNWAPHF